MSFLPCNSIMTSVAPPAPGAVNWPTTALRLEVLKSLDRMISFAPAWLELLERCQQTCIFSKPLWHIAWWRAFGDGKTPHIVVLHDEHSRLVGVIPLLRYHDRLRGFPVRVLGSYNNDHASRTDMLVEAGYENLAMQALAAHLARITWSWDVILLRQLPEAAAWLGPLMSACRQAALTVFKPTPGIGKCVLPLNGTWDEFVATRSRHFRSRLRENIRRIQKQGSLVFRQSSGCAEDFDVFVRLEEASWKNDDGYAKLGATGWAFQREIALATHAGIHCHNLFLELDGRIVGGVHTIAHAATAYSMQMLFDESVRHLYPGRAQFATMIAGLFADQRYEQLDLNGNSAFCKSWSETELPFVDLQIYGRQPYSRLLAVLKHMIGRNR